MKKLNSNCSQENLKNIKSNSKFSNQLSTHNYLNQNGNLNDQNQESFTCCNMLSLMNEQNYTNSNKDKQI